MPSSESDTEFSPFEQVLVALRDETDPKDRQMYFRAALRKLRWDAKRAQPTNEERTP